jgi:hypothetical protein
MPISVEAEIGEAHGVRHGELGHSELGHLALIGEIPWIQPRCIGGGHLAIVTNQG